MRAGNLALIAVLLAGTMAWAGDETEGALWKRYPQTQGGLRSSVKGSEDANRAKLDQIPAGGDRLEAFRNAYYFAYAVPAAGGLDMDRDPALDFAAKTAAGSDPKRYVQVYQTVFYDQLESGASIADARKTAKRVADNPRGGNLWALSTSEIRKETHDWAVSPDSRLGPGLPEAAAAKLAEDVSAIASRSMEGTDRATTNKFVAFRSLFYLANSKPTRSGRRSSPRSAAA